MPKWISVTIAGTTTHPDAPRGATVFTGSRNGAPVVFYMTGGPAKSMKTMLKLKGGQIPAEVNADQILR